MTFMATREGLAEAGLIVRSEVLPVNEKEVSCEESTRRLAPRLVGEGGSRLEALRLSSLESEDVL